MNTILIVEDDSVSYHLLSEILNGQKMSFIYSANGKEAVEICRRNEDISLVLMDVKLPEMDGLEATREIKKLRPELPVYAITACALYTDRKLCYEAGCDEYLAKPFLISDLLSLIRKRFN